MTKLTSNGLTTAEEPVIRKFLADAITQFGELM
jgi:hypothetical protein